MTPMNQDHYEDTETILENFSQWLECRHKADNTIKVYSFAVRQFFQLYHQMDHQTLQLYKCYLLEHYKPQTVNLRIRAVNCFLEFLQIPDWRLTMLKVQQKTFLDNVISQADYEYLKKCLIRDDNKLYYFLIRFMAATGVRVSELVLFQIEDVRRGHMDILSKGNKIRRIYIPKSLRQDALVWLKQEDRDHGLLFLKQNGEPVTPASIRGQLHKFHVLYGLDAEVLHPHAFRHRFAKNFIDACGDLSFLSDILGHQNIETTRIYLHRTRAEQQIIVNQVVNW